MTLMDNIAADIDQALFRSGDFALSATYTPPDGAAVPVVVVRGVGRADGYRGADGFGQTETFAVRSAEIPDPVPGGRITIGEEEWEVVNAAPAGLRLVWRLEANRV